MTTLKPTPVMPHPARAGRGRKGAAFLKLLNTCTSLSSATHSPGTGGDLWMRAPGVKRPNYVTITKSGPAGIGRTTDEVLAATDSDTEH